VVTKLLEQRRRVITIEKLEEIDVPTAIRNIQTGVKQRLQSMSRKRAAQRNVEQLIQLIRLNMALGNNAPSLTE
jgi:hypothetical protein